MMLVRTCAAWWIVLAVVSAGVIGCAEGEGVPVPESSSDIPVEEGQLFTRLPSAYTGIDFTNELVDTQEFNIYTYRNYYNGGGVAVGDLTGNGLPDIYLTSNQGDNKLYLNQGDFRFNDVTDIAGVAGNGVWSTCAVMADVNGNGLLDLYVCYSGDVDGSERANELYINQGVNEDGVPIFTEEAAEWGVADEGYSIHAVFFDSVNDGKLDLYVLNNSFRPVGSFGLRNIRHIRDENGGDRFYRNTGDGFQDVSEEAGIYGSEIAFGLGVAVGDINRNGFMDIYVSNDFFERDYLYLNNGDGTFTEALEEYFPYITHFSMGSDIADINNNGFIDLYVTDMLPEDDYRLKTTSTFDNWDTYQTRKRRGYHHQYMRNMLHMNNGDGTFSDIGHLAGVARTDWSWSALIADFDLDGKKDIFVTNGMYKNLTDQDFIAYLAHEQTIQNIAEARFRTGETDFLSLVDEMSSDALPNYLFRNDGNLSFTNMAVEWGVDSPGSSHGAAYADLNNDGALDLIVSNVNQEVGVYRNNARQLSYNRFLQIKLEGDGSNRYGIGTQVTLTHGEDIFYQEQMPMRGFQSSVDYVLTFGVGTIDTLDAVFVQWPDGRSEVLEEVATNQRITVAQENASAGSEIDVRKEESEPLFEDITSQVALNYAHEENYFVDFDRDRLIPKKLSIEGPHLAVGDVTGNGRDDMYIGGAAGQPGALLLQGADGQFRRASENVFDQDRASEDVGAVFFDATGNGHLDLYVVSGGNEFATAARELQDRLYLNDGRGNFEKASGHLPERYSSGSRVVPADINGNGHLDLFIGGRVIPWEYGFAPESAILLNDGSGRFRDATRELAPELARIGMVTDASWVDVNGSGRLDLVVVGDWMPITIFEQQEDGTFEKPEAPGLEKSNGWWNRIVAEDLTGNGYMDFLLGNLGRNTRLQASAEEPVTMLVSDFNRNGRIEHIVSYYNDGVSYPLKLRDNVVPILSVVRSKFPSYKDYAGATVEDIFTQEELEAAEELRAYMFESALVKNNGDGTFEIVPLPVQAQLAPMYGILLEDFDGDGNKDILMAGNFRGVLPEIGRMTASWGVLLKGNGEGGFEVVPQRATGFRVPGETRDLQMVYSASGEPMVVVARNNDTPLVFRPNSFQPSPTLTRR